MPDAARPGATARSTAADSKDGDTPPQKPAAAQLEEDDEFEDFPVQDWAREEEVGQQAGAGNTHLWEESWDDDDAQDEFAAQLKEELKKMSNK